MKRVLITGASGFVGSHLAGHLLSRHLYVAGFDLRSSDITMDFHMGELADRAMVSRTLLQVKPDVIFHLAGMIKSSAPEDLYKANLLGTTALFDSIVDCGLRPMVVLASSSAVYGSGSGDKPITEKFKPHPITHYAVSKLAQEIAALRYFDAFQLPVMIVRMFNVLGAGQSAGLACSSFARQIALAELHGDVEITTGDLSARRDFVDVRDAVRAFALVAEKGMAGQVYNLCSGHAVLIRKCLDEMLSMSTRRLQVRTEVERVQKDDVPVQVGSAQKLKRVTGWRPQISLKESLSDLLEYWRQRTTSGLEK